MTYHSLQTRVEKRFRSGGLISGNYTWSKGISDSNQFSNPSQASTQDYLNLRADRSVVGGNTPNRAVIAYVLNLPFGKGQQFGSNVHGAAGAVISGWAVNGITTFQSGWPLALNSNGNFLTSNWGGGTLRPNYTPGCQKIPSGSPYQRVKSGQWFNTSCFTFPTSSSDPYGVTTFGNHVKLDDKIRQEGMDNWDFTASKTTTIHESMNLVFKAEFFNIFNHPLFNTPGTNLQGSRQGSFGQTTGTGAPRLMQLSLRLNF